jgi:hypothetical protein
VWCVGGNVGCLAGPQNRFRAAESDLDFAVENGKHLLKVVAVWRRAATRRDKHVYEAVATGGVRARQKDWRGVKDSSAHRSATANAMGTLGVIARKPIVNRQLLVSDGSVKLTLLMVVRLIGIPELFIEARRARRSCSPQLL